MKNKSIAMLLALFLGGFGAHKFYLERYAAGVFYLLFCWTLIPAVLAWVDFFGLLFTSTDRFNKIYN